MVLYIVCQCVALLKSKWRAATESIANAFSKEFWIGDIATLPSVGRNSIITSFPPTVMCAVVIVLVLLVLASGARCLIVAVRLHKWY